MKFVASVVTKDGTFRRTVISPLTAPTPQHTTSAIRIASPTGTPRLWNQYSTHAREQEHLTGRQVDLPEHEQQHLSDRDPAIGPA